jgi:single-stranded-DNA-specific exonuclease
VLAEALARELDGENKNRQDMENEIIEEAIKFVEEQIDLEHEKVLVVCGEGWHQGVVGIVASKQLERYNRPCIVISVENGIGKGSGRSLGCFNLFAALSFCGNLMDRFGGHEMAAGLTIPADKIGELRSGINAYADTILTDADLLPCIKADAFLERADIVIENVHELAKMAPFGAGNPAPVFGYTAFTIASIRALSAGKHLKLGLTDAGMSVEGIGFNMGELMGKYAIGDVIDAIFSLEVNT